MSTIMSQSCDMCDDTHILYVRKETEQFDVAEAYRSIIKFQLIDKCLKFDNRF